jgi:diguanylate cyclase (GGDEF)-like protein
LTGIGNRRFLHEALEQQLARSRRYGESGALLVLDLDGFKAVNDTVGHAGGDDVLRATAQALVRRARDSDLVARLGGDEFAVLLLHVDEGYADRVAEELREAVDEALAEACEEVPVGASFGRVMLSSASDSVEELLAEADAAMYAAKRERGGAGSRRFSR